jgi:pimeloyl-ACP methyl ester carboxylesterase
MEKLLNFEGDGVSLKASAFGNPAAPPILFLHATCQTRWTWNAAANLAARRGYFAIAPDLRGHGLSSWAPDGDYSPRAFASDVVAILDQLKRPVTIVGHSLGGWIALAAGAQRPDRIRMIVSFDAAPTMSIAGNENFYDFYNMAVRGFDTVEEAAREVSERFRVPIRNLARFRKRFVEKEGRLYFRWDPKVEMVHKVADQYQDWLLGLLEGFPRPTVLMLAEQGSFVSGEAIRAMHARIPRLAIERWQGTYHAMTTQDSMRVAVQTISHLERLRDRSPERGAASRAGVHASRPPQ